jgi:hypothetical protein
MSSSVKKIFILSPFVIFKLYSEQNNSKELGQVTEKLVELYIQDTLKRPFQQGDYIAIGLYSDKISLKRNLYIETLDKDFRLYKKSPHYKWYNFQNVKIIIFCELGSFDKCSEYFQNINFQDFEEKNIKVLDQESISYELDGDIRVWKIKLNQKNKITDISGKIIEAEIANPEIFKKFLEKYSVLKLYQMNENGIIISVRK